MMLSIFDEYGEEISLFFLAVLFGVLIIMFVKACIKGREERKQLLEELEQPYVEPKIFEYKAVVVDKYFARKNLGGVKMPQTKECCYAVFKTQDGKLWDEEISLESFYELQENQSVIIGVADGKYCGFCVEE